MKTGSKIRPHIFPRVAYAGTEVICVKKQRICSTWIGLLWVIFAGTLLHFVYGWTGENRVVGLYAPVSESSWEHLKLLFTPFLIYTIAEYFWLGKQYRGYLLVRAEGVWLGMLTILSSFYTYQGILGFHCLPLDILTFLAGAGVCARFCTAGWNGHRAATGWGWQFLRRHCWRSAYSPKLRRSSGCFSRRMRGTHSMTLSPKFHPLRLQLTKFYAMIILT